MSVLDELAYTHEHLLDVANLDDDHARNINPQLDGVVLVVAVFGRKYTRQPGFGVLSQKILHSLQTLGGLTAAAAPGDFDDTRWKTERTQIPVQFRAAGMGPRLDLRKTVLLLERYDVVGVELRREFIQYI